MARDRTNCNKQWTPNRVRERIRVGVIVNRLQKHALGEVEMTPTQIRAAEVLLKKAIPDLSAVEHSGEITNRTVKELSESELCAIAAGGSAGTAVTPPVAPEPAPVH